MGRIKKLLLFLLFLFQVGCAEKTPSSNELTLIQPNSIRAKVLLLSSEDIWILHQNTFEIERKIYCQKELTLMDVVKMHELGLSAETIIAILEYTKSIFDLTSKDVIRLQLEGVSYQVINFMINT